MPINPNTAWPAPAKLNLFLHINGRLPSGYHRLQTLFQMLDWGDQVTIRPLSDSAIRRDRDIPGVPESVDLCLRAARLLQAETGCNQGAVISVSKQVPIGAGLGGGSSDAATVLHVLNKAWACGLSIVQLSRLGLKLGADVPFFIQGHSAWGEGVGELLKPHDLGDHWYVLLMPGIDISTAGIFSHPELPRATTAITPGEYSFEDTRNDCQALALRQYPELARLTGELSEFGDWRMTGTGSTFFLRAASQKHADSVTQQLKCRYNVRAVRGVNRSPLLDFLAED